MNTHGPSFPQVKPTSAGIKPCPRSVLAEFFPCSVGNSNDEDTQMPRWSFRGTRVKKDWNQISFPVITIGETLSAIIVPGYVLPRNYRPTLTSPKVLGTPRKLLNCIFFIIWKLFTGYRQNCVSY